MPRKLFTTLAVLMLAGSSVAAEEAPWLRSPLHPPEEHYRLDVRYQPEAATLAGSGVVRLKNTTGQPLRRLAWQWEGTAADEFDVTLDGHAVPLSGAASEPQQMDLPAPLPAGGEIEFAVRFRRAAPTLGETQAAALTHWHPRLWWGYGTHAAYDVGIDAPAGVQVAASAPRDTATGRYHAAGLRSFGLFFARGHDVLEAAAGDALVRAIFHPEARQCAELLVKTAVDSINFFRERFGFYPHRSLAILPGEPNSIGGYPFATAMVMIHAQLRFAELPETHWRWITAHEIGHQYWLEHVLAHEPEGRWGWLMIGLGLWVDREYSRVRGMAHLHPKRLGSYADAVRKGFDTTVEMPPEQVRRLKFDYNSVVTHNKAFGIVSALAAIVGAEVFERAHARALREYAGRRLSATDFRRIVEQESGQHLGWFFTPLLRTNGYASCEVTAIEHSTEAGLEVARVRLRHAGDIRLPVPVEALFADGSRARQWADRLPAEQTLVFRGKTRVEQVKVDPDGEFPLVIPAPDKEFQALAVKVLELPWTGSGDIAAALYPQAVKFGVTDEAMLARLALTLYDGRHYEMALEAFTRLAAAAPGRDYMATVWQGIVLDLLGRREEALARYRTALAKSDTPTLTHSQYRLTIDRAWVEQRLNQPFTRP
jgi:tetratricopeptide (TPR) repeat protein